MPLKSKNAKSCTVKIDYSDSYLWYWNIVLVEKELSKALKIYIFT